jgi:hypothetical protein
MKYKNELIKYFKSFSDKNIDLLSEMFSDEIELTDWNISAIGKDEVIEANRNIFNSVNNIQITPINFYLKSDFSYAAHISIVIDGIENLNVIDVIEFGDDGLILSINAYKIF